MTSSTHNEDQGTIKSKSLMTLLSKKVELKKELIVLKKQHENKLLGTIKPLLISSDDLSKTVPSNRLELI